MKKLTAMILALAMLLAVALGTAEQAAGEKTLIGMSLAEVKEMMGRTPDYQYDIKEGMTDVEYLEAYFADMKTSAAFILENDKVVMGGFYGFDGMDVSEIDQVKQAIADEYGESFTISGEVVKALFEMISGMESYFTFTNVSGWQPDEETVALAFQVSQEYEQQIYVVFVSADYAAQIGIVAGPDAPVLKPEAEDDPAIQGTWEMTDVQSEGATEEELAQTRKLLSNGTVVMRYTFDNGKLTVYGSFYGAEETQTGTYRVAGNQIIAVHDGETTEETVEYLVNGDTLELRTPGMDETLILTRQN